MNAAALDDVGLAACGNFAALRRLRDHWLDLASGRMVHPLVLMEEAQAQLELLAEMSANGINQAEDWIALLVAYQLRVAALERDPAAAGDRLTHYRDKVDAVLAHVFHDDDAEGSAMLVAALTHQADAGDERAVPLLQSLMDSVTPERAQAIQAEVRKLETADAQSAYGSF